MTESFNSRISTFTQCHSTFQVTLYVCLPCRCKQDWEN